MLKALKFTLDTDCFKNGYIYFMIYLPVLLKPFKKGKKYASAGNRTRINCLEGSYADHYTTDTFFSFDGINRKKIFLNT